MHASLTITVEEVQFRVRASTRAATSSKSGTLLEGLACHDAVRRLILLNPSPLAFSIDSDLMFLLLLLTKSSPGAAGGGGFANLLLTDLGFGLPAIGESVFEIPTIKLLLSIMIYSAFLAK